MAVEDGGRVQELQSQTINVVAAFGSARLGS
jgi:hypothetical protein